METLTRRNGKMAMTTVMILGMALTLLVSPAAFAEHEACEKYHKHMEKYHKHVREAEEEARDRDWDDYHEEIEKAQRNLAKAEAYKYLCIARGGCSYREPKRRDDHRVIELDRHRGDVRRPRRDRDWRDRDRHGRDRHDDRRRNTRRDRRPRRRDDGFSFLRNIRLLFSDGHFEISLGGSGRGHRR